VSLVRATSGGDYRIGLLEECAWVSDVWCSALPGWSTLVRSTTSGYIRELLVMVLLACGESGDDESMLMFILVQILLDPYQF